MTLPVSALGRAALAGAATGCRSQAAMAACALTGTSGGRLDKLLHKPVVRRGQVVAAFAELVGDKLPQTPSRTSPPGLVTRLVLGAAAPTVLAARRGESQRVAAAVGLAAAAATTFGGVRARAAWSSRLGSDLPGALAEDALAIGVAVAAARLR